MDPRSRRRSSALVVAVAAIVLMLNSPGFADPQSDKTRVDHQLAQTQSTLEAATGRAQQAAAEHDRAVAAMPGAQSALDQANGRAIGALAAYRQATREEGAALADARDAGVAYRTASTQVEANRQAAAQFAIGAYEGAGLVQLDSILTAESPNDLTNRIAYLEQIASQQHTALTRLTGARRVAAERKAVAASAEQQTAQAAENARLALAHSQQAQNQAQAAAVAVQTLVAQTAQADTVAAQERAAVLAQYNALKQESDKIGAQLRAYAAQHTRTSGSGGTARSQAQVPALRPGAFFLVPVHGWKSSDFGMRFDPFYKVWQLHAGVDLAASTGTPIAAAAAGIVVRAGWYGGYGNYTCISHGQYQGQGIATCYGHQSKILVKIGQQVRRGDIIGLVGATGAATGAHLHFEVRLNGNPVNPLGWLPGCLC